MEQLKIPEGIQGFGRTLRWCREQHRMTIVTLARKLDISAQFWSDVEHERKMLSWDRMVQAAALFNVDPNQLKVRVGTMSKENREFLEKNPEIVELLRELGRSCRSRCHCPHCLIRLCP